ncbi:MAG: hypothetical protein BWY32_01399 [bacterium ADurb.Bin243]|nr:MAG: hypothetical protein BWY32_01399 [bacterium ADurb.Bin243]HOD42489.1 hypothetical protein [Candidatus Wallbacteria bacterium]
MPDTPRRRSAFSKPEPGDGGQYSGGYGSSGSLEPDGGAAPGRTSDPCVYGPQHADISSMPENIKVDLTTPLEWLWVILSVAFLFAAFYFYSEGNYGHYSKSTRTHYPPSPHLLAYVPYALFSAAASFLCWLFTNNYYIFNTRLKKIFYHFKIFSFVKITEYLSSEQIIAIGVTGRKRHSKRRVWWEYKIVVVDNHGVFTDLSNSSRDGLYEMNEKARGMAAVMGCQFAECHPECILKARVEGGSVSVYFDGIDSIFSSYQRREGEVHPLVAFAAITATLLIIFAIAYITSR